MSWLDLTVSSPPTHHVRLGTPAYAERFDEVLAFHTPGLAPVRRGAAAWHIRPDGEPAYERRFRRTFGYYEGLAAVEDASGWHHIKTDGVDADERRYAWSGNFQGGRCTVRDPEGRYFHIDPAGRPLSGNRWAYAGDYRDGVAVVQAENGLSTHVDRAGRILHDTWFLDLDVFHKGFARARDTRGWTHVDISGRAIYNRRFANVEPFYNGQARVECFDGGLEVIDEHGRTVLVLRDTTETGMVRIEALGVSSPLRASLAASQGPRVILVRHADRFQVAGGSLGIDAPLTPVGELRARLLGTELGDVEWSLSSPVERCRRTAVLAGLAPADDTLLGMPGPFVTDEALGGRVFSANSVEQVVRRHLAGETWGCMRTPAEGGTRLLARLRSELVTRSASGLAVSHDAIVMPVIAWLTGHDFAHEWLDPLDGLVVTLDACFWRGQRFEAGT